MTLQEALKVNGLAISPRYPWLVYFLKGGDLWSRHLSFERKSDMKLAEILETAWMAYVKPCAHEPILDELHSFRYKGGFTKMFFSGPVGVIEVEKVIVPFCGKCGVKLKSEKWIADEQEVFK